MAGYVRNPQTIPDDSPGGSTTRQAVADQNNVAVDDLYTALNSHSNNEDGRSHVEIDQAIDDIQLNLVGEVEQLRDEAELAATQSASSAIDSSNCRQESYDQAVISTQAASSASTSEVKAQEWAENPEDDPVETGKFSALHWSAKAESEADRAEQAVASIDLTDYPSDVPVYNLLADIGIINETVARNSQQGYITPSGNLNMMGTNQLSPSWKDGRYGLEIYGSGVNEFVSPDDLTSTWLFDGVSAPSANKLLEDTSLAAAHRVYQLVNLVSGEEYSCAILVDRGSGNRGVQLDAAGNTVFTAVRFDLANKVVDTESNAVGELTSVGDKFLCVMKFTADSTIFSSLRIRLLDESLNPTYDGDGVSFLNIYFAQYEQSAFPTPFIDGIREACNVTTDSADWFNPQEGTFVAEFDARLIDTTRSIFGVGDDASNRIRLNNTSTGVTASISTPSGSNNASLPLLEEGLVRASMTYSNGVFNKMALNGGEPIFNNNNPYDLTFTSRALEVGASEILTNYMNSTLHQLLYIPKAVSDDELIALSRRAR